MTKRREGKWDAKETRVALWVPREHGRELGRRGGVGASPAKASITSLKVSPEVYVQVRLKLILMFYKGVGLNDG